MIKRADWYIGRAAILAILAVWVGFTLVLVTFNLLDELGPGNDSMSLLNKLWYVAMTAPRTAYMVFPVSALIGTLIGIGGLAASNELVAFRIAGLSRLRIAGSAMGAVSLLIVIVMVMGEWVAPAAETEAREFKYARILGEVSSGSTGVWARDGNQFVHIARPLVSRARHGESVEFLDVVIYSFAQNGPLDQVTSAVTAVHDGERWMLQKVRQVSIGAERVQQSVMEELAWESSIKPELLDAVVIRPRYMSMRSLWDQVNYLGQNGLNDRIYRSALWDKLLFPLTVLALVLAGMPFVFGSARQHSMGLRIFVGISVGALFIIVSRTVQNFGDAYGLPAVMGAGLPAVLLAAGVIIILRRSV
jgi:lipopolysaccharide export system permease protein